MFLKMKASLLALIILTNSPTIAIAALQLLSPYGGSTCGANTFSTAIDANGVLTCSTPTASTPLSGITAATGANTIANSNNTGQVWNWANTTNSTAAFTFGETSAGTNGTSTNGVPNQVLLKLTTLASSTQSPLSVYSRGSHVFSVSTTSPQIFVNPNIESQPGYSFTGSGNAPSSGMYWNGTSLELVTGGNAALTVLNVIGAGNQFVNTGGQLRINATPTTALQNSIFMASVTQGNLGTPDNGTFVYCSDCTVANPCASGGSGAFAKRLNGVWVCN